jgi:energy-coupling factor transport system ATP-binding protein
VTSPAVELESVRFSYPDGTEAIRGVSLTIESGETVAVVGQNGSGKSTLVRQLNGLLHPTAGMVRIDGVPLEKQHVADLARLVAIAFQNPDRQIFGRSVGAEVRFGVRNARVSADEADRRARSALERVGLGGIESTNPYDLGYSRRKLLGIASILAMETPIVVLDEPTTGQDARGFERIGTIVDELRQAGKTVIAISHDMRFVAERFGRVIVMRAGEVILDGAPEDVFGEPNWPALASTFLEPPYAARLGAQLGLGSTPTDAAFVAALGER